MEDSGRMPGFKASLHCGTVTTGGSGAVRKGSFSPTMPMNTTARIKSLCNENGVDLLVSEAMMSRLRLDSGYHVRPLGLREL
jgi:adenylate cyclase